MRVVAVSKRTLSAFMMFEMGMKTHDKRWIEFQECLKEEITQAKFFAYNDSLEIIVFADGLEDIKYQIKQRIKEHKRGEDGEQR